MDDCKGHLDTANAAAVALGHALPEGTAVVVAICVPGCKLHATTNLADVSFYAVLRELLSESKGRRIGTVGDA